MAVPPLTTTTMSPMTRTVDVLDTPRLSLDHVVTSQNTVADLVRDMSRLRRVSAENIAATVIEMANTVAILPLLPHTPRILDEAVATPLALATVTVTVTDVAMISYQEIHTTAIAHPDGFQPTNLKLLETPEEAPLKGRTKDVRIQATTIASRDLVAALQKPMVAVIASLDPLLPCKRAVPQSGMPNQKRESARKNSVRAPTIETTTVTTIHLPEEDVMLQPRQVLVVLPLQQLVQDRVLASGATRSQPTQKPWQPRPRAKARSGGRTLWFKLVPAQPLPLVPKLL